MKKIVLVVVIFVLAIIGYVIVGPFITIHQIKSAVEKQDSEQLSDNIDFPVLRSNLKEQFNAMVLKSAASELKGNPFGALAVGLASKLVEGMVESFVTPSGLVSVMEGEAPSRLKRDTVKAQASVKSKPEPFKNARNTYDSPNKFSVWVKNDNKEEIRFVFTRNWLSWKLSNIILPTIKL